jgi:hypothetical protein
VWVENKTGSVSLAYLSDATGRLLARQRLEANTATLLMVELLEQGVYYLRINDQTHKIIVQR